MLVPPGASIFLSPEVGSNTFLFLFSLIKMCVALRDSKNGIISPEAGNWTRLLEMY